MKRKRCVNEKYIFIEIRKENLGMLIESELSTKIRNENDSVCKKVIIS